MDRTYLPILFLAGFVVVNAVGILGLSHFTVRSRPTPEKQTPYESGITPLGDARERFSVKFYMVAMLFVLFDIEVVFMYPWALVFRDLVAVNSAVFWSMASFATILLVAYLYALRKGALKWND